MEDGNRRQQVDERKETSSRRKRTERRDRNTKKHESEAERGGERTDRKKASVLRAQIFLHTSFLSMSLLHPLTRSLLSVRHPCRQDVCVFGFLCVCVCVPRWALTECQTNLPSSLRCVCVCDDGGEKREGSFVVRSPLFFFFPCLASKHTLIQQQHGRQQTEQNSCV